MLRLAIFVIAGLMVVPTYAQVFKCKDSSGKVEYRNSPCPAGAKGGATDIPVQSSRPSQPSYAGRADDPNARQLTALVAEAIADKNYNRAKSLALTTEHHQMIQDAMYRDASAKQARREAAQRNRPITGNCADAGFSSSGGRTNDLRCTFR